MLTIVSPAPLTAHRRRWMHIYWVTTWIDHSPSSLSPSERFIIFSSTDITSVLHLLALLPTFSAVSRTALWVLWPCIPAGLHDIIYPTATDFSGRELSFTAICCVLWILPLQVSVVAGRLCLQTFKIFKLNLLHILYSLVYKHVAMHHFSPLSHCVF